MIFVLTIIDPTKVVPGVIRGVIGEQVEFTCNTHTNAYWQFNSKSMLYSVGSKLIIPSVTLQDNGTYECTGYNKYLQKFYAVGILKILGNLLQDFQVAAKTFFSKKNSFRYYVSIASMVRAMATCNMNKYIMCMFCMINSDLLLRQSCKCNDR